MAPNPSRRTFLKNSAALLMAAPTFPSLNRTPAFPASAEAARDPAEGLERAFLDPPDAARPWVYWMVSDGDLTPDGITADLEAMHRVGIRGAIYMECSLFTPAGPARFLSPRWRELVQHAVKEATRLGITLNMNNDGGYCGSGGPWITPELSMQVMVWTETALEGPQRFTGMLPQPKTVRDYYRDIVVLAFPTPAAEGLRMAEQSPQFSYGLERHSFDDMKLIDGSFGGTVVLPPAPPDQPQYLNIDFPEPFTAQALSIALTIPADPWDSPIPATLEVSADGRHFHTVHAFTVRWPVCSVNFPSVASRHFRIALTGPSEEANWLFRTFAKGLPLSAVELHPAPRLEEIPGKASYARQDVFSGGPELALPMLVPRNQILDLSRQMDGDGRLTWNVPAGKWTVLRIGHTSTGKTNHPAPQESLGLECDKLSQRAIEVQFAGLLEKLLADQAAVGGTALAMTHVDSWEVGAQNWTLGFREEFQKRRGYDLLPYLAVLTGRAVESREVAERFLWDLRRTVGDLLVENYAAHLRDLSHQHGLKLSLEAYGAGPFDDVEYAGCADLPMCEFWSGTPSWTDSLMAWCKEMASAGHIYGKPIIPAESFTSEPESAKWQSHPFRMKPVADMAFTLGVNRLVFHRYSMQPWLDRKPGTTFGPFGVHYERTNTWWEQSVAWHTYLARCQSMLQSGQFVADVAYLGSEASPSSFPRRERLEPLLPAGYDFDDLPPSLLREQMQVRNGRLALPSGMSYRILVLPLGRTMTPALLEKIKALVAAGATVVGPPPSSSPSLAGYPACDEQVRRLAAELWGDCDGVNITENRHGEGKVVWGTPLADVLAGFYARPDFACLGVTPGEEIRYIHRRVDDDDVYFVSSALPEARRFLCTFRVAGKRPELWWPDTGRMEPVAAYDERFGGTTIPLALDPCGSVFVVFRGSAPPSDHVVSLRRNGVELSGLAATPAPEIQLRQEPVRVQSPGEGEYLLEVTQPGTYQVKTARGHRLRAEVLALPAPFEIVGPWELEFPPNWGAPEHVTLERLISWPDHPDPGVKYFSGTAVYRRQFDVPAGMLAPGRRLYLDLGRVSVIAQPKLNGRDLGTLWKPPFRADITERLHAGANDLVVSVVNLWPNRLIGDEQLPDDCEWLAPGSAGNPTPHNYGSVLALWPQWLLDHQPSPTGRMTFTTWKHWTKDDPLLESGLLGPVRIETQAVVTASADA